MGMICFWSGSLSWSMGVQPMRPHSVDNYLTIFWAVFLATPWAQNGLSCRSLSTPIWAPAMSNSCGLDMGIKAVGWGGFFVFGEAEKQNIGAKSVGGERYFHAVRMAVVAGGLSWFLSNFLKLFLGKISTCFLLYDVEMMNFHLKVLPRLD